MSTSITSKSSGLTEVLAISLASSRLTASTVTSATTIPVPTIFNLYEFVFITSNVHGLLLNNKL